MDNPTGHVASGDGTSIAYYDYGGDGPAVVLVHGITENASAWHPVAVELAKSNRVISLDLRGHGASGSASTYDLGAMAGDVGAVIEESHISAPHLVGHSLGGVVVSAAGAAYPVASVTNVDQALALAGFQEALAPAEAMLRDPATFPAAISQMFGEMYGPLADDERVRLDALRRPDQEVVLGVWALILESPLAEIEQTVDAALANYASNNVPYLSIFGMDPGPDYASWLTERIPNATVELWADHGHYPHLVDTPRFLDAVRSFWA